MKTQFNVLVIDDDEDDQYLIRQAFENDSKAFNLQFASDGTDVLENIEAPTFLPDLVLLDLNMPVINGFEVLRHFRDSPNYKHVPVVVLTTSSYPSDIERAYQLGANSYVIKPDSHEKLVLLAERIRQYWFNLSELPLRRTN